MGVEALQVFLENSQVEGSVINADLVRIASSVIVNRRVFPEKGMKSKQNQRKLPPVAAKFSLVLDAECCLNRLYGGYFSDWVCGGQWNRLATFLGQLANKLALNNIELVVFFNGCSEQSRHQDWIQQQLKIRTNINQVLRHINHKGTPPPKVWWTAPNCLRSVLRMALRNLNIPLVVSMDDHRQEVIAYCRENSCDGIVADDPEYIAFDPPRYFSSQSLKLTYKGTLDTKEYIISELAKGLGLDGDQLCVLVALLGNYVLPESELADLHKKLASGQPPIKKESNAAGNDNSKEIETSSQLVKSVAEFVKSLTHTARQLDKLGLEVFGTAGTERAAKLKQAVQYYLNGTQTDFLNYRLTNQPGNKGGRHKKIVKPGDKAEPKEPNMDTSRLASESVNELESLISITEARACLTVGPDSEHDAKDTDSKSNSSDNKVNGDVAGNGVLVINAGSSSSSGSPRLDSSNSTTHSKSNKPQKQVRLVVEDEKSSLPQVPQEVLRTVNERHNKGLMSPMIYQILTQGEIRLGVVLEEESHEEVPNIQIFFRPMRQMVYAILFNLHHHVYLARNHAKENKGDTKIPEVKIKEWVWSKNNPYLKPDTVRAEQLGWGVPTVQRLWFGTTVDDKRRRLRAYLTCMRSDTQLMLDSSYVPQHLLVLATVLRYIMSFTDKRVLRKYELDAIIATALDPHLANSEFNQELKLDCVSSRSVQVGSLIMAGIEHALLVNDTCGAPIPWVVACPWLYFDGKLLHCTMARAASVKNALELCSHRLPQVMKVERMREAILEGLYVQWARPQVPSPLSSAGREELNVGKGYERVALSPSRYCICEDGHVVPSGGGRLEIAGVVVGNWGANCRLPHEQPILPPQVTSVGMGGVGRGRGFNLRGQGNNSRNTRQNNNRNQNSNNRNNSTSSGGKKNSGAGKNNNKKNKNQNQGGSTTGSNTSSRGQGRGTTAVSPFTGEVVDAHSLVNESFDSRLDDSTTEEPKQQRNQNNKDKSNKDKSNKQQNMRILHHQNNQSGMVNGKVGGKDAPEPFADTNSISNDMMRLKMNGTEEVMNSSNAAKDN